MFSGKNLIWFVVVILVLTSITLLSNDPKHQIYHQAVQIINGNKPSPTPGQVINQVIYTCTDNKTINATFYKDSVHLYLSDGRSYDLPQTEAGSGIRYANDDESFVFWSKSDSAYILENNIESFTNCSQTN